MGKLNPFVLRVTNGLKPWQLVFTHPAKNKIGQNLFEKGAEYCAAELLRQYPGIYYAPKIGKGKWAAPIEALDWLKECAEKLSLDFSDCRKTSKVHSDIDILDDLHPYQKESVAKAVANKAWLFAYDMGLGKTAAAIEVINLLTPKSILVVCPAVARPTWVEELNKWLCGAHSEWLLENINVIKSSKEAPKNNEGIYIISFGCLAAVKDFCWDTIIFDEVHYLGKYSSQRSKLARKIRDRNPEAICLGLSGTPMGDDPTDLHNPLDILFPDRFGWWGRFCERYSGQEVNKYSPRGYDYKGLSTIYGDELKERLKLVMHRVTKAEVAHLLPPLTITQLFVEQPTNFAHVDFDHNMRKHEQQYTAWLQRTSPTKLSTAVDWVKNAIGSGEKHVAVMTHLRVTAKNLAKELKGVAAKVTLITGHIKKPEERNVLIKETHNAKSSIVICTMASVGIAINSLAIYNTALFVELAYWPVEVLQAMARFHRLNSNLPTNITLLLTRGGLDEPIAHALKKKLNTFTKLLGKGGMEEHLQNGLDNQEDKEAWQARLLEIASNMFNSEKDY